MKLRLRHNSIRLRLTQGEVRQLQEQWQVEERIELGVNVPPLIFSLVGSSEAVEVQAEWLGQVLTVTAPQSLIERWAASSDEGFTGEQSTGGTPLKIVVEKDFQCLVDRGAEDADTFPHPHASATC